MLSLLYRGPLEGCNYGCSYCPFGRGRASHEVLERDEADLARLVGWVRRQTVPLGIMFTPRGEGLTRDWYRRAMVELSHLPAVRKVVIQSNGSGDLSWVGESNLARLALWLSFHPTQVAMDPFVAKCRTLVDLGARFSVGMVGTHEQIQAAETLRSALPREVYLWLNAFKDDGPSYYSEAEVERLTRVDPLFPYSLRPHDSAGQPCWTGESVFSVDGDGNVRRCHFVDTVLGNLYRDDLATLGDDRGCPNRECGCHIGYVHLKVLDLHEIFSEGLLERIPARPIWTDTGAIKPI